MHEIVAQLIPLEAARFAESHESVAHVRLARIVVVPRALPKTRPKRIVRAQPSPSPRPTRIIARTIEGRAGLRRLAVAVAHPAFARPYAAKPVWDVAGPIAGAGQLASQTASGETGSGSGAGAQGSGSGAATGDEPCGFVEFSDPHGSSYDSRTRGFYVDIRMSVHFADGSMQSLILDYPWYYPSEAANPWSDQNVKDPNFPTRFQAPPSGKVAAEPALVRYVIAHSTADGMTLLRDCPGASAQTP